MISCSGFSTLIAVLVRTAAAASADQSLPVFIAAVDKVGSGSAAVPFYDVINNLDRKLNSLSPSSQPRLLAAEDSEGAGRGGNLLPPSTVTATGSGTHRRSSPPALWSCHLPFSVAEAVQSQSQLAQGGGDAVWAEYLRANQLSPLSLLVAGPPRCGKTDVAKLVADR